MKACVVCGVADARMAVGEIGTRGVATRIGSLQKRWNHMDTSQYTGKAGLTKTSLAADPEIPVPLLHTFSMRVKELRPSLKFYQDALGLQLLHWHYVKDTGFSCAYMGGRPKLRFSPARVESMKQPKDDASRFKGDPVTPQPGTLEAHDYVFHNTSAMLELIELHDERDNHRFKISSGNEPGSLGYGGCCIMVENLTETCRRLHLHGRSKILAEPTPLDPSVLCTDPNGYHIRLVERRPSMLYSKEVIAETPNIVSSGRLRTKNPEHSVFFYENVFNMKLLCKEEHASLGLTRYHLACKEQLRLDVGALSVPPHFDTPEALDFIRSLRLPLLELQHHHGTEHSDSFSYHSGNSEPLGFSHLGFMVEKVDVCNLSHAQPRSTFTPTQDVVQKCVDLGVYVLKNRGEGAFPQSAYLMDPDGYWVEVCHIRAEFESGTSLTNNNITQIYPRCMRDTIIRTSEEDARSKAQSAAASSEGPSDMFQPGVAAEEIKKQNSSGGTANRHHSLESKPP